MLIGILPTPSQTTARTTASCGTTVAGIRHFSTRAHRVVPTQSNSQKQYQIKEANVKTDFKKCKLYKTLTRTVYFCRCSYTFGNMKDHFCAVCSNCVKNMHSHPTDKTLHHIYYIWNISPQPPCQLNCTNTQLPDGITFHTAQWLSA